MFSLASFLVLFAASEPNPPDKELAASIRAGSSRAFRELFDRYHGPLYRFLMRMGLDEPAVQDILQDVFSGIWEARNRLDASRSIRAYLYRSCRNRALNHFRNQSRFSDSTQEEPPSPNVPPDDETHYRLLEARLHEAVAQLPDRRRAAFELCFINGLSYKEAAEVLGLSPKTVENHMGYAFKTIRERLAGHFDTR